MPNNKEFNEISRAIGDLEGTVRGGFISVNSRLDKINGRLNVHDTKININEANIDKQKGVIVVLGGMAGVIVSFAANAVNKFLGK